MLFVIKYVLGSMLVQLTIIRNILDKTKNDLSLELSKLRCHLSPDANEN